LRGVERELRAALLLMGAADVAAARCSPRVLTGELRDWSAFAQEQGDSAAGI